MRILFPDNAELTNFRDYTSFADLFNPTINKVWEGSTGLDANERTLGDWFKFLKAAYTRDNIRNNICLFLPDIRNYRAISDEQQSNDIFDKVFANITEDKLWMLYFLRTIDMDRRNHYYLVYRIDKTGSLGRSSPRYVGLKTLNTQYTVQEDDVPAASDFVQAILSAAEDFEQFFTDYANRCIAWDSWFSHNSQFFTALQSFWKRRLTYRSETIGNVPILTLTNGSLDNRGLTISFSETNDIIWQGYPFTVYYSQKITKDYREPLYQILRYSTNPCSLIEWPIVEPGEHKPMLYGVELECSFDYPLKELIDAAYIPFFIAKEDSSVNGSKRTRAELVTVPMSLKALKRHYAHWFRNIDYSRFDVTRDTNNGMHVHMDRKGFDDDKHIRNMTWFYLNPANRDFLVYVSERGNYDQMSHYSPIATFASSLSKVKAYRRAVDEAKKHRGIVNFGKPATIEIRMFRGIVSFAELCKNLEFVDAVFHFSRGEKNLNRLSMVHFLDWLKKTPVNRYTVLKKFIDRCKNIDDLITACEVYNEVFNVTDPDKIKEILNKSKLQLTNAHVTVLNKGKRRTFVLNRETGLLDIVITNRSKLADVDRTIESRYTRNGFAA